MAEPMTTLVTATRKGKPCTTTTTTTTTLSASQPNTKSTTSPLPKRWKNISSPFKTRNHRKQYHALEDPPLLLPHKEMSSISTTAPIFLSSSPKKRPLHPSTVGNVCVDNTMVISPSSTGKDRIGDDAGHLEQSPSRPTKPGSFPIADDTLNQ